MSFIIYLFVLFLVVYIPYRLIKNLIKYYFEQKNKDKFGNNT